MKKIFSLVLALIMVMSLFNGVTVSAATVTASGTCGDNLTWTLDEDGLLTISGTGSMKNYTFLGDAPWWYSYSSFVKSVNIKNGVTSIGDSAFFDCTSLTRVTIPDSVTSIGNNAFRGCTSLTRVTIPDSVTSIGEEAFFSCTSLTRVTIPDSVTSIGYATFCYCTSLTRVTIPDSVTSIGDGAFGLCYSLTEITIPDSVTRIVSYAFYKCTSLTRVTIPDSVTSIGGAAFSSCDSLKTIIVASGNEIYHSRDNCIIETDTNTLIVGCKTSVIPDYVTSIGNYVFYNYTSLTEIAIPDSVTSIGSWAFAYCDSLTDVYYGGTKAQWNEINISSYGNTCLTDANIHFAKIASGSCGANVTWTLDSDGVLTISGEGKIADCEILSVPWYDYIDDIRYLVIDNGVTGIGDNAFASCENLSSVSIPGTVTSIGMRAFSGCDAIETVDIPEGVKDIYSMAFYGCKNLSSVSIPESVTYIAASAFEDCKAITDVYYAGSNSQWNAITIGSYNGNLKTANIHFAKEDPPGIAWGSCGDSVTWLLDNDGLLTISGEGAMYDYTSSDFPWCDYKDSITSVVIEDGVTYIGAYAFYTCTVLTEVDIPETVTSIGDSAFRGCTLLSDVEIPETVTSIGDYAFRSCKSLPTIKIPYGVTSIGLSVFSWCEALTSIDIPETVTSIGEDAFRGCLALTTIRIPDGVTSIGNNVFRGCSALASIEIPDTLTSVGDYAFSSCTALTDVYYGGTEAEWNKISLGKNNDYLTNANIHFAEVSATISGTVKSFGDALNDVTVELLRDGIVIDSKIVTGNGTYTFERVSAGEYTVRASKSKHAARDYDFIVYNVDVTQDIVILIYGDVTGDGVVNSTDTLQMNRKIANLSSAFNLAANSDYRLKVANITGITGTDTLINSSDILQINRKIANLSSIFDKIA